MNAFVQGVKTQEARTTNGMKAMKATGNACVDLFYKAGAMRGKVIALDFAGAYAEDREVALRIAQWLRDVRGGAGERDLFRQILTWLENHNPEDAERLLKKIPIVGRWDDIFVFKNSIVKAAAFTMLGDALRARDGLAAKWTPRQGPLAAEIRNFFGMSPKFYRKSLVELSNTVEQLMCANKWDEINFSHVPSVAAARYKKAFWKKQPDRYKSYVDALLKGDVAGVKINASAIFPYDVLKPYFKNGMSLSTYGVSQLEKNVVKAQWDALPNYVGDGSVLAMVDVSGSMGCKAGANVKSGMSCMQVAMSLGLYVADKNKGPFKDTFLTFSGNPELMHLPGDINTKLDTMVRSNWDMNTNFIKALDKILDVAVKNKVPAADMPQMLLCMSDMQFDRCAKFDDTAMEAMKRRFEAAGYTAPKLVFWNINSSDNAPAKYDTRGVALVSGFSPAIAAPLLGADADEFSPEGIMLKTVMVPKYDI